ncbi:hypothetical protein Tco_0596479 [Tanacetum coccineum]
MMAQQQQSQIIPVDQLVSTRYQSIRRCNNYNVLQNIPCSVECKIVGQILIDHALTYVLTATSDVPTVETITYTVDMFHDTLQLSVETPDHPFIEPAYLKFIQRFLKSVGYEGSVDKVSAFYTKNLAQPWQTVFKDFIHYVRQKKDVIQYPRFTKLIIVDLMKKFPYIAQRHDEKYHSIKDDIPLYKKYENVFCCIDIPTIQPQPVKSTQGTNRTPRATKTPTIAAIEKKKRKQVVGEERDEITEATLLSLTMHKTAIVAEAQENVAKVQEKILEEDIAKMVNGEDEDSYASAFANLVF